MSSRPPGTIAVNQGSKIVHGRTPIIEGLLSCLFTSNSASRAQLTFQSVWAPPALAKQKLVCVWRLLSSTHTGAVLCFCVLSLVRSCLYYSCLLNLRARPCKHRSKYLHMWNHIIYSCILPLSFLLLTSYKLQVFYCQMHRMTQRQTGHWNS